MPCDVQGCVGTSTRVSEKPSVTQSSVSGCCNPSTHEEGAASEVRQTAQAPRRPRRARAQGLGHANSDIKHACVNFATQVAEVDLRLPLLSLGRLSTSLELRAIATDVEECCPQCGDPRLDSATAARLIADRSSRLGTLRAPKQPPRSPRPASRRSPAAQSRGPTSSRRGRPAQALGRRR